MPIREIYLKIETIADYSPVAPDPMPAPPRQYARDCMRNPGHGDGTIPLSEVNARTLTALVYREYLDPNYLVPKPDKLVLADVNEPPFHRRVPGTVIYTHPGERLRVHVLNGDISPHSLHMHGLAYGIDSDGSWPLGTQNSDDRRSDEICPNQSWTYTFDVTDKMIGAWPFHDHWQRIGDNINRGLFGGVVVLPRRRFMPPPVLELQPDLKKLLQELNRIPFRPLPPWPGPLMPAAGGGIPMPMAMQKRRSEIALDDPRIAAQIEFLKEWVNVGYIHPKPHPVDVLHVPIFFHFMSGPAGTVAFDSGAMAPAATFEVTFGTPGTFNYHCTFHPMAGSVTVAAAGPSLATVSIEDSPTPRFNPPNVTIGAGGKVRWTHVGNQTHSVTEDAVGVPSFCFNGRSFVGNTPTILAETGQHIRWYVFNLDIGMMWHNFHTHGQRWQFAGEVIDTRSIGPAESFVVETTAPPVLLLPPEIEKTQSQKKRPRSAKAVRIRGDFLFHCHVEMHMMAGLAGLVRSRQTLWLTPAQADQLRHETGLPEDHGDNDCQPVDPTRCEMLDCGRWEEVTGIPEVCMMHVMPLPGTRKLLYWGYGDTRDDISRLWDYSTAAGAYSAPANQPFDVALGADAGEKRGNANLWSAEHAFLDNAEGTVLAHGGFTPRQAYLFHSSTLVWERTAPTHEDRFYATTVTLADGRQLTLFGSASKSIEIYDPSAGTWSAPIPLPPLYDFLFYPWTYLLPGGDLFIAGTGDMGGAAGGVSRRFQLAAPDPPVASYPTIGGNRSSGGEKGTSVLLALRPPDYKPRVIILGGNTPSTAQTAEWIDLSAAAPAWSSLPNLNVPRGEQVNSVLLPDGRVMVAGGASGADGGPVEIFDPQNPAGGWQQCAVMKYTRGYHSTAILLVDGSVLMGGDTIGAWKSGETTPNERYYPWYYFRARPVITSAPASVNYASTFTVSTPSASSIGEVVLIRPGAVTHGFNMSQRFVGCEIVGAGPASIQVKAPPDGNIAPPGWYLLFLVNVGRVPSEAAWIQLTP